MPGGLKFNQKNWQILSFLYQKWIIVHNLVAMSDTVSVFFRQCRREREGLSFFPKLAARRMFSLDSRDFAWSARQWYSNYVFGRRPLEKNILTFLTEA